MKRFVKLTICLNVFFWFGFTLCAGDENGVVRLMDLVELARQNSPLLKMAQSDIAVAEGLIDQAKSEFSPTMRFSFAYKDWDQRRSGHMGAAPGATQFYSDRLTDSSLQLRQLLLETGRARNQLRAARTRSQAADDRFVRIEQELLFNILSTGITSISQQAKIEAVKQNIEDVSAALHSVGKMQEFGKAAGVDVLRVEFRQQEALAQLDEALHQHKVMLSKVARFAGIATVPLAIEAESEDLLISDEKLDLSDLETTALKSRSDLIALEYELKAAGYDVEAAKKLLHPQLSLVAAANRYGDSTGWGMANGFAGIEVTWPFLDGGLSRGRVRVARAIGEKAKERLKDLVLTIKDQVRVSASALNTARARISRSEKGLMLAEEAYRIELLTYENGKGTINDLLDAQSEVFNARARLIQDKMDLKVANLALKLAIGELDF